MTRSGSSPRRIGLGAAALLAVTVPAVWGLGASANASPVAATSAVSITGVVDGAAPFSATDGLGQDSAPANGRVRAGDVVRVDVRVIPGGTGSIADDVTLDVTAGGLVVWSSGLPAGCAVANAGVHCDFGPRPIGDPIDVSLGGRAAEQAQPGNVEGSIAVSTGGTPVTRSLVVATAPVALSPALTAPRLEGLTTRDGVDGIVLVYGVELVGPAATALASSPAGSTVDIPLDASGTPGAVIVGCGANGAPEGAPASAIVYSAPASGHRTVPDVPIGARLADGGTWACVGVGASATATVSALDTNPDVVPTRAWDATALPADADVLTAGAVRVFVPLSSIGSGSTAAFAVGLPGGGAVELTRQDPLTADRVGAPAPGLVVVHTVNGVQAPTAPGAEVVVGAALTYQATVINTGNVAVDNVTAADPTTSPAFAATAAHALAPGESWTITYAGTQPADPLVSTLTVTADPGDGSAPLAVTDAAVSQPPLPAPESLAVVDAGMPATGTPALLEVKTQLTGSVDGQTFTALPGPIAVVNTDNLVELDVKNPGSTPLTNVVVSDSTITNDATAIDCGLDSTNKNLIATLAAGATVTCSELVRPTAAGSTAFTLSVTVGAVADASLAMGYQAKPAALDLQLGVGGQDADTAPGPSVTTGSALTFSYVLHNIGQIDLANVAITHQNDDAGVYDTIACGTLGADTNHDATIDLIQVGASVTCTFSATAVSGAFNTTAVATGTPAAADGSDLQNADGAIEVSATDPLNYTGVTGTGSGATTTTTASVIGNGGANSGPLALVAGLVFLSGLALWGVTRRRRHAV